MKKKEKKEENKIWKWFRHLTSLGVGGAVLFLFPNFVITQLSFLVGILVGKGIISMSLGFAITTFLGSQAGLWLQKGILALLSYIISNLTLKLRTSTVFLIYLFHIFVHLPLQFPFNLYGSIL